MAYWIPVRSIAGKEKDKWLECSNCGNMINLSDIEKLRFSYRNNLGIYIKEIETEYYVCSLCKERMNIYITHELIARKIAKGDSVLNDLGKNLEFFSNYSCELRGDEQNYKTGSN